jgi:hypothetical protein
LGHSVIQLLVDKRIVAQNLGTLRYRITNVKKTRTAKPSKTKQTGTKMIPTSELQHLANDLLIVFEPFTAIASLDKLLPDNLPQVAPLATRQEWLHRRPTSYGLQIDVESKEAY